MFRLEYDVSLVHVCCNITPLFLKKIMTDNDQIIFESSASLKHMLVVNLFEKI